MSYGVRRIDAFRAISSGAMTGNITSTVVDIRGISHIGVQFIFTGTPTGTFTIECSNDYGENGSSATWEPITTSPATISASGSAGDHLISLNSIPFGWLRAVYTFSSGTGTLNCYITGKE